MDKEENSMIKNKRKRDNKNTMDIDEDDNGIPLEENKPSEIITFTFVFSCMSDDYFPMIKSLLRPNFSFETISLNGLTDMVLSMKEDVGVTIKNDNDDDVIFGVFTMIPLSFFNSHPITNQVKEMLLEKAKSNENIKTKLNNLLKKKKFALLINERIINLAAELIAPALHLMCKEINECITAEDYDGRFNIDYVVIMSRYVKEKEKNELLYYKYETPYFRAKAELQLNYKINFVEHNMELCENKNQPQYMNISIIKSMAFYKVLSELK